MLNTKRSLKYTNFDLYSRITNSYWQHLSDNYRTKEFWGLLSIFKTEIEVLTKFMLEDRFISNPSKPAKDKLKLKDPNQPSAYHSVDYLAFTGQLSIQQKKRPLLHRDIHLWFKALEIFILTRTWSITIELTELGHLEKHITKIVSTLPTLLLVVGHEGKHVRKDVFAFLFSVISIYRQFKMTSRPDTQTITERYGGDDISNFLTNEFSDEKINRWLLSFENHLWDKKSLRLSIYSGNASSPNSGASATKLLDDAAAVKEDRKLSKAILSWSKNFEGSEQFDYLVRILFENIRDMPGRIHSKLFHFTSKGGKARIIANVDWLTQTSLSGMHFYLYRMLKTMSSDFTFDHKKGLPYLWSTRTAGHNFYSIDLSAATDRMPVILQSRIIKGILDKLGLEGESMSNDWRTILDREYSTKKSALNNEKPVRYAVGQGMGIFTSWPIMAMTHHYIVNGICGITRDNYALVGDDLVIRGRREDFDKYISILTKMGMKINKSKTLISEGDGTNDFPHNIEFARNYIMMGVEVKPYEYGILFAWNDEKCSFESFFYAMRNTLKMDIVVKLIAAFSLQVDLRCLLSILYFFFKYNIKVQIKSIVSLLPEKRCRNWVTSIRWDKFHEAVTATFEDPLLKERNELSTKLKSEMSPPDFMWTFTSDLIVRTKMDAALARDLAQRISYLRYIDDEIGEMALQISRRLFNVELIRYDIDEFGSPLVSKRAKRLIAEIVSNYVEEIQEIPNETENSRDNI